MTSLIGWWLLVSCIITLIIILTHSAIYSFDEINYRLMYKQIFWTFVLAFVFFLACYLLSLGGTA